jgi:hypothetical protein
LLNLGEREGNGFHHVPIALLLFPLVSSHNFSLLSFFTRGNYLLTNHGAVIAGPALSSLPVRRGNPVPLYDPATASTFHLSSTHEEESQLLTQSIDLIFQFSIKLLLHICLSDRNKLRRTRRVVDRGRGQESGLRTHLERRPSCTRISIADHSTSNGFGIDEIELGLYFDAHPVNLGDS